MKNYKIADGDVCELSNGIRIWTIDKPQKHCKTQDKVHIGIYIYSGLFTEEPAHTEYNHIIEHLIAMLPSKKYPDSRSNNTLMEKNGITAFGTVDDYKTHIWLEGFNGNFDLMLDLFSNGLLEFTVDDGIYKQEITAVLTELTDWYNNPFLKMEELQRKILFPNHPQSVPIKDHISNVKKATPQKLEKYFKRLLDPKRMLIYISGNLTQSRFDYGIKTMFNKFKNLKTPSSPALNYNKLKNYVPHNRKPKDVYFIRSDTSTTKIEWVWLTNKKYGSKEAYISEALESIMQDKLFDELRMDKGLVYSIKISAISDPINEYLSHITASTDVIGKDNLKKVMKEFIEFINRMPYSITKDDILQFRRKLYRSYQDKFGDCTLDLPLEVHAENLLFLRKTKSLEKEMNDYLNISLKDIRNFVKKYINTKNMYIFYSGKYKLL